MMFSLHLISYSFKYMEPEIKKESSISVPVAIIVAGIIIAGAVFFSRGGTTSNVNNTGNNQAENIQAVDINLAPVNEKDHIIGNPDASIVLVEYSDLECPACKFFHPVVLKVMDTYGKAGQVAWVFRNFPIAELHPKAQKEHEAAECVNELGGNQKYWAFIDKIFEVTPANNGLDPAQLPIIASDVGINKAKFNSCFDSGKYKTLVASDYQTGVTAGVQGTPTSFLVLNKKLSDDSVKNLQTKTASYKGNSGEPLVNVSKDGKIVEISAAFPYEAFKIILDTVLEGMK